MSIYGCRTYTLTRKRWLYFVIVTLEKLDYFLYFRTVVSRKFIHTQAMKKYTSPITYLRYLVKMKHHNSFLYSALTEYYLLHQACCETKFIKYRENKLVSIKYVQNVNSSLSLPCDNSIYSYLKGRWLTSNIPTINSSTHASLTCAIASY